MSASWLCIYSNLACNTRVACRHVTTRTQWEVMVLARSTASICSDTDSISYTRRSESFDFLLDLWLSRRRKAAVPQPNSPLPTGCDESSSARTIPVFTHNDAGFNLCDHAYRAFDNKLADGIIVSICIKLPCTCTSPWMCTTTTALCPPEDLILFDRDRPRFHGTCSP